MRVPSCSYIIVIGHSCTHALGHYELSLVHSYYYFNLDTFSLVHSYTIRLASCTRIIIHLSQRKYLLPTGSEEREVLGVGSTPVAILPSCKDMETIAL